MRAKLSRVLEKAVGPSPFFSLAEGVQASQGRGSIRGDREAFTLSAGPTCRAGVEGNPQPIVASWLDSISSGTPPRPARRHSYSRAATIQDALAPYRVCILRRDRHCALQGAWPGRWQHRRSRSRQRIGGGSRTSPSDGSLSLNSLRSLPSTTLGVFDGTNFCAGAQKFGGRGGIRTRDLFDAIEARSQLRHTPTAEVKSIVEEGRRVCQRGAAYSSPATSSCTRKKNSRSRGSYQPRSASRCISSSAAAAISGGL